jgi:hypothetical protein
MANDKERDKLRLQMKVISRNLSEMTMEDQKKLVEGLKNIPQKQMMEQAQYIENILLPKIEQTKGIEDANYKFYQGVVDSLLWAICIVDRYEFLQNQHYHKCTMNEFLQEQLVNCKKELDKYYAAEDLTLTDSLNKYAQAVAKRAQDKLNKK